jgi:hypothetical protein
MQFSPRGTILGHPFRWSVMSIDFADSVTEGERQKIMRRVTKLRATRARRQYKRSRGR